MSRFEVAQSTGTGTWPLIMWGSTSFRDDISHVQPLWVHDRR